MIQPNSENYLTYQKQIDEVKTVEDFRKVRSAVETDDTLYKDELDHLEEELDSRLAILCGQINDQLEEKSRLIKNTNRYINSVTYVMKELRDEKEPGTIDREIYEYALKYLDAVQKYLTGEYE